MFHTNPVARPVAIPVEGAPDRARAALVPKLRHAFDSPEQKRLYVRTLFATIADRYDLITIILSFGRDRAWKRRLVREAGIQPDERVVDVACGTGDLAFAAAARGAEVAGLDVTLRMAEIARSKAEGQRGAGAPRIPHFGVADMMSLPLADESVDVVTTGYGLRNVPRLDAALDEIARVLKPGGRLASLDFNRPRRRLVRWPYLAYLTVVGSVLGTLLHRDPDTYRYIPESVRRYPGAHGVAERMRQRGFTEVRIIRILGGFLTIHVAVKDAG